MCIAIATTNHPDFPFILLSNRDEFFKRPTMPVHFRSIEDGIKLLSPLDLARPEHGTWIGVTTSGKVSVLVNYHEADSARAIGEISRGILPLDYLCSSESDDEWRENLEKVHLDKIGGFTLLYGQLKLNPETAKIDHLHIVSNRGEHGKVFQSNGLKNKDDISYKPTFGLSNSLYNEPWKKVEIGEGLLDKLIDESIDHGYSQEELVDKCFELLSYDTYDRNIIDSKDFEKKIVALRDSVFIPPLIRAGVQRNCLAVGKYYGTRTQTIILLDKTGHLNYYEKNIHNSDDLVEEDMVAHYKFSILHQNGVMKR
ncbi:Uncharacterized protein JA1_001298 [Spathaspora sp. JA1]|nr:Uncharacterized protein JA1_001298 [Spathaspora sp. JA1]